MSENGDGQPKYLSKWDFQDSSGHCFKVGNPGGLGNPHVSVMQRFRQVMYECVTREDMIEVMAVLIDQAKKGRRWAVKELLDRMLGKPKILVDFKERQELVKFIVSVDDDKV